MEMVYGTYLPRNAFVERFVNRSRIYDYEKRFAQAKMGPKRTKFESIFDDSFYESLSNKTVIE